jgi:hypothetical protein
MKRLGFIVLLVIASGLFLTSCEKEHECNPLSVGNGPQHDQTRDGEIIVNSNDDTDEENDFGITDSGRDEDYDKSGKKKKP